MTTEQTTINLQPSWTMIMPGLIHILEEGTEEGKKMARQELYRLAVEVDKVNGTNVLGL